MTESASGSKDEDILSSIRHLVSARPGGPAAPGAGGRLLLTPALRVASPPDETPCEAEPPRVRVLSLEERIAELEAAVGGEPADWEPDGSEDARQETPDAVPQALAAVPVPGPTDPEPTGAAAAGPDTGEFEAAGPGQDAPQEIAEDLPGGGPERDGDTGVVRLHLAGVAPAEPTPEPATATFRSAQRGAGDVPDVPRGPAPAIREDGSVDEEALRQLVAAVVREELRGQFGERITRGIRRMVRREIEKALTARDLD